MKQLLLSFVCLVAINTLHSQCTGTGSINYQQWNNITGGNVSNLTSNANYPNNPSVTGSVNLFEAPSNIGNNIGVRIYGYICPPVTGTYYFWVAADNAGELWLSTTSFSVNKVRIAYTSKATKARQWNASTSQKSVAIPLVAGIKYYVEALMKESTGNDNLAVGWSKPGQSSSAPSEVIPGSSLSRDLVSDIEAPSVPSGLAANFITTSSYVLAWLPSVDNIAVTGYDVYRNGVKLNSTTLIAPSYSVTGLAPNTTYNMTVRAKDAAGNESVSAEFPVTTLPVTVATESFNMRTVIARQRMPHDLLYGPDDNLWYTERFAGTVSFVNPSTGTKRVVLTLGSKMVRVSGQDGLMGLALHPEFLTGKPFVYIAYTYQSLSNTVRRIRVERYSYDAFTQTLIDPVTILENIPGSNDHNSCRLAVGPDTKLYFTIGDMGAGQFDNISRTNNSQNLSVYEGKILRFNTELESGSWIPADNPFTSGGQPTAVFSFGHRNAQGLVWGNVNGTSILYSSEHGPYSDDEINIIESGRNYGWPQVSGYCDGNYNGRNIGGFDVVNEQTNCTTLNAKEPLRSIFPSSNPPTGGDNMLWPSIGPSGTDFYGSTSIPGWQNSLLVATLKGGVIARYKLSNDGLQIISDTINYFRGMGRYRDVAVSPDGLKIYVACDSSGSTSGPTGNVTTTPANPGSILEFTYVPGSMRQYVQTGPTTIQNTLPADKKDNTIDIYPNPATNFIVVYNYAAEAGRMVTLFDMNGRTVKQQLTNGTATRIDTREVPNGMYILRITNATGSILHTEKLVIRK
ncbi:T9SS type A sorting domain-containing protein [Lacibacter luteus]|uniref:T9SS type A sorting domain-containing protein n=1 Tax=Lacibacter luteus TaxID=2508719 RepID=A0A4Q1CGZ3_9BACT|nr:PQQ-dependent sugar dehydrogenase [Lacibacter luteus]RXK59227.1 T9SS type A sorting domain-containing protein [Lacibacter luteus]